MEQKGERKNDMDWVLSLVIITISLALPLHVSCSDVYSRSDFPEGFAFGSGTSAYQVRPFSLAFFLLGTWSCLIEMLGVVFVSGKGLLLKTGESRASGILSSTLVCLLLLFFFFLFLKFIIQTLVIVWLWQLNRRLIVFFFWTWQVT